VTLKGGKLVLKVADAAPKAPVPLHDVLLQDDDAVAREDGLLQVLTKDGQLQATLVGHHTDVVQLLLGMVQKDLRVGKVAAEGGRQRGLDRKALVVAPPIVLIACTRQLCGVKVDKACDGVLQNVHHTLAPIVLDHLEGELLGSRQNLPPANLADDTVRQLTGTLLKEAVAPHLGARAPKAGCQLH
jgi:hypothetical protein